MSALPPSSDLVNTGISKATFKAALSQLRSYLAGVTGTLGTQSDALATMGVPMSSSLTKTGAYTLTTADRGKVLVCTGTWTLSLQAASVLGDGFVFGVWNNGTGVITTDPNLSELIDNDTTKANAAGKFSLVYCNGVSFTTVGGFSTGAGSGLDADKLDGLHADELSYLRRIASGSVSAVSTLDVTIDATLYSRILIVLDRVIPSTDGATLRIRPMYSGGVISDSQKSHILGSAGIYSDLVGYATVIAGYDGSPTAAVTGVGTSASETAHCCVDISGFGSTAESGFALDSTCGFVTDGGIASGSKIISSIKWGGTPRVLTGARLSWSAGSFEAAGTYKVYGLRRGS